MMYGCNNNPRPTKETWYWAQDGYQTTTDGCGNTIRIPKYVKVYQVMTTSCGYDKTKIDPKCEGCGQVELV